MSSLALSHTRLSLRERTCRCRIVHARIDLKWGAARFDLEPLSSCRSTRTVCPDNCSQGQGFCTADGLCQCHAGFAGTVACHLQACLDCPLIQAPSGFDCSYASTSVKGRPGAIQTSRVDVGQWQFYHFDVVDQVAPADDLAFGSQTTCVLVTVSTTGSAPNADPELFMSFGEMPSLTTAQWSNRSRTFPSTIVVRGTPTLHLGRYYIGVHGGCCQPASFQLTVSDSCGPMVTGLRQAGAELFKVRTRSGASSRRWAYRNNRVAGHSNLERGASRRHRHACHGHRRRHRRHHRAAADRATEQVSADPAGPPGDNGTGRIRAERFALPYLDLYGKHL